VTGGENIKDIMCIVHIAILEFIHEGKTMTKTISINQIKDLNARKGYYFFSPNTIRFFHSRTDRTAIIVNHEAYFITSEQREHNTPRKYTIRKAILETGDITTIGKFHSYDTHKQAKNALMNIIKA
jgi:hypothetical protein